MKKLLKFITAFISFIFLIGLILAPLSKGELVGISSASSIAASSETNSENPNVVLQGNASEYLLEHGYSLEAIQQMSKGDAVKAIINSGHRNMNKTLDQIRMDLFGNSSGPVPIPNIPKTQNKVDLTGNQITSKPYTTQQISESPLDTEQYTTGQACLVVVVWDYVGTNKDIGWGPTALDAVSYNVEHAEYDYVKELINQDATHQNIWEWLTWMCAAYQHVDVYFFGHGADLTLEDAFTPIDGLLNDNPVTFDYDALFYPEEIYDYYIHPYDYSTLRLGVGGFCHSFCFEDCFLYSQESHVPWPNRVWIGSHFDLVDQYTAYYFNYFGYYWYTEKYNSQQSANEAATAVYQYHGNDDVLDHFQDSSQDPIVFPHWYCCITMDQSQYLLYANIWVDGVWIGCGTDWALITPGSHPVESDQRIWDDHWETYVFPLHNGWDYYFDDTAEIDIFYAY
jgi:hypothetical protein